MVQDVERFTQLFGTLLAFVYHCFGRIMIRGNVSGLSRPEQVIHFIRRVLGIPVVGKEVLSRRTDDYRTWVEAYARNHPSLRSGPKREPAKRIMSCPRCAAWRSKTPAEERSCRNKPMTLN